MNKICQFEKPLSNLLILSKRDVDLVVIQNVHAVRVSTSFTSLLHAERTSTVAIDSK